MWEERESLRGRIFIRNWASFCARGKKRRHFEIGRFVDSDAAAAMAEPAPHAPLYSLALKINGLAALRFVTLSLCLELSASLSCVRVFITRIHTHPQRPGVAQPLACVCCPACMSALLL